MKNASRWSIAIATLLLAAACAREPDVAAIGREVCRPLQDADRSTRSWPRRDLGALIVRIPPGYAQAPWPNLRHSEGGVLFARDGAGFVVANTYTNYARYGLGSPVTLCEVVVDDMPVTIFLPVERGRVTLVAWFHRKPVEEVAEEPLLSMEYDARTVLRYRQVLWSARAGKGEEIVSTFPAPAPGAPAGEAP